MRILFAIIASFFCVSVAKSQVQTKVSMMKYEELEKKIQDEKAEFVVVNFWSTTCAPCVKELPHFIDVNNEQKENPNFKMLLVSLDRAKDQEKVLNFITTKNLTAEVVLLDDIKRMNTWIPRFDENWDGVIPVTLFYEKGKKVSFHNGEMSKEELQKTLNQYLKM